LALREHKREQIEQLLRALKALPPEHETTRKIENELLRAFLRSGRSFIITPISFESSAVKEESKGLTEVQINKICEKVKDKVIKQIRSELSALVKSQEIASISRKSNALSDTLKLISQIPEVNEAYFYLEDGILKFIIIHDSPNRIDVLRKVIEVENTLDEKFEDLYFDFIVLHRSEMDHELIPGNLIFKRR